MAENTPDELEIYRGGKKIYGGADRRDKVFYPMKTYFGLTVRDLIFILGGVVWVVVFSLRTDQRIAVIEDAVVSLNEVSKYTMKFTQNSDKFNERIYDTEFNQGKPVDGAFGRHRFGITKGGVDATKAG